MNKAQLKQLTDLDPEDRIQKMKDECYAIEDDYRITRDLTDEEIELREKELVTTSIQLDQKRKELKEVSDPLKIEVKALTGYIGHIIQDLEDGTTDEHTTVYLFPDRKAGVMRYLDNEGKLVHTRNLAENEQQTTIAEIVPMKGSEPKDREDDWL